MRDSTCKYGIRCRAARIYKYCIEHPSAARIRAIMVTSKANIGINFKAPLSCSYELQLWIVVVDCPVLTVLMCIVLHLALGPGTSSRTSVAPQSDEWMRHVV